MFSSRLGADAPVVYLHSSETMPEIKDKSVKLLVGASVYLGKRASWDQYSGLYRRVYRDEGLRVLRDSGVLVVIQTDAYEDNVVVMKSAYLPALLLEWGYEILDTKIWQRRRADHYQVPFSNVWICRPAGGTARRWEFKDRGGIMYFQGVWAYTQAAGGPLAAYPDDLCRILINSFTEEGDLICDPFAGTARLLGMAHKMGRSAVGYEINADMARIITSHGVEVRVP